MIHTYLNRFLSLFSGVKSKFEDTTMVLNQLWTNSQMHTHSNTLVGIAILCVYI